MHAQGNKCYRLEGYRFTSQLCSTSLHLTSPTWTDISSSPCTVHLHVCHRGMTHLSPPPLHHHHHETPLHCDGLSCTAGQCGTTYTGKQNGAVNARYRYMPICQAPYLNSMLLASMQTDVLYSHKGRHMYHAGTVGHMKDWTGTWLHNTHMVRYQAVIPAVTKGWVNQLGNSNVGLHIHVHRYRCTLIYTCVVSFTNNMVMHWETHGQFTSYKLCRHTYIRYDSCVA